MNMFYKIWVDSEEGRNTYGRVDVHWSQIPGRDEKWKAETIANTSEDQFRQEYECVDGKTNITIKNKITGIIKKLAIKDIINNMNVSF
jgi:hypothetical protein